MIEGALVAESWAVGAGLVQSAHRIAEGKEVRESGFVVEAVARRCDSSNTRRWELVSQRQRIGIVNTTGQGGDEQRTARSLVLRLDMSWNDCSCAAAACWEKKTEPHLCGNRWARVIQDKAETRRKTGLNTGNAGLWCERWHRGRCCCYLTEAVLAFF